MDMDMDIGWCLTCAKRTADTHPSTPTTEPLTITSPLPPKLIPLPPPTATTVPDPAAPTCPVATTQPPRRSSRAFSFPASEEDDRPSLPNFNRKPKAVNATARSFKVNGGGGYVSPGLRMSTTGTNTPNDSAFYSTSDSERDGPVIKSPGPQRRPPLSPLASVSALHPLPPLPLNRDTTATSQATSLSSQLHTARPSLETRPVSSPVTRMASSSSRSREDIISWARDVRGDGPDGATVRRGRGRRPEALANLTPPSTEPLDEPPHAAHTPTASALNALNVTFGPVVNALRNVSLVSTTPESSSALGLQACPAPTTLSRIDVVATTQHDMFVDGCTPTLSTISLSEAVDTSNATDLGETIESATDGFSVASSHYRTPPVAPAHIRPEPSRSRVPYRAPLQQAASAVWSIRNYLSWLTPSFTTPFSLSSSTTETVTVVPVDSDPSTVVLTPALGLDLGSTATAAVPAAPRSDVTEAFNDPALQLVRSVPMDIVIAAGSKAQAITEERAREREVIEYLHPRSTSRSRERTNAAKPALARQPSHEGERGRESDDERGRGRRRGRRDRDRDEYVEHEPEQLETPPERAEERGRRRDRGGESRDRSWSAARGRTSRTRASVRA